MDLLQGTGGSRPSGHPAWHAGKRDRWSRFVLFEFPLVPPSAPSPQLTDRGNFKLRDGLEHRDLTRDYFDHRDQTKAICRLVRRLQDLGCDALVTAEAA
jgi:hypothetical protein